MDSINSFIHLLDKIETQDRRLGMTIKNLRCLAGGKSMELAYAMALKLAEESEKLTLLTRALPAYTGLFLVRRDRIWITRWISLSRPMTGSSLP